MDEVADRLNPVREHRIEPSHYTCASVSIPNTADAVPNRVCS